LVAAILSAALMMQGSSMALMILQQAAQSWACRVIILTITKTTAIIKLAPFRHKKFNHSQYKKMKNPQLAVALKQWAAGKASELFTRAAGVPRVIDPYQVTESKLRSDTLLSTGQSYNNISFQASKASPNTSEFLLQINDSFLATGIRLSAKKLTATPTNALHQKAQEFTYPNTYVFDGTAEVTTIFGLWNATISITQNQSVAFPKIWTGDLKFAPDSQYGSTTGVAVGPLNSRQLTDSKNGVDYGFCPVEPILFMGSDQTRATLDLGTALDITEASEYNYFTISLQGFLISGK